MDRTEIIARQCELENRILHGQINAQQVEHEIAGIEAKYGKDAFNPCKVTPSNDDEAFSVVLLAQPIQDREQDKCRLYEMYSALSSFAT